MKRIWTYIIGGILLLVTTGSVILAYSVIVSPSASSSAAASRTEKVELNTADPVNADTAVNDDANVQRLSRETSYVEKSTGVEFPGQIGVFVKTRVRENLNPLYGVAISYQTPDSPCADIYVYSLDPEAKPVSEVNFAMECERTHHNVLNMKRDGSLIDAVREIPIAESYPAGVYAKWYEVSVKGEKVHSHLLMLCCAGKIIKIRVSFPVDDAGDLNDALLFERTILDAFKRTSAQ